MRRGKVWGPGVWAGRGAACIGRHLRASVRGPRGGCARASDGHVHAGGGGVRGRHLRACVRGGHVVGARAGEGRVRAGGGVRVGRVRTWAAERCCVRGRCVRR